MKCVSSTGYHWVCIWSQALGHLSSMASGEQAWSESWNAEDGRTVQKTCFPLMTLLNQWFIQPWALTELLQMGANTIFLLFTSLNLIQLHIAKNIPTNNSYWKSMSECPLPIPVNALPKDPHMAPFPHFLQVSAKMSPLPANPSWTIKANSNLSCSD